MRKLIKKMFRDLWQLKSQFVSIFLMCMLGMLIYSGIEGVWNGMQIQKDNYFSETNVADIWVNALKINTDEADDIKEIDGIATIQLSAVMDAYLDKETEENIRLIANDTNEISIPMIQEGSDYNCKSSGIWLDYDYANAKNLKAGDRIKIFYDDIETELTVQGLVYGVDFISYTGTTTAMIPNHERYTYGFVSFDTLKKLNDNVEYNQLKIKLADEADSSAIKGKIKTILRQKYFSCITREENTNISSYVNKIGQIRKMSIMFSVIFFLLSLLTIRTTMKRVVQKQRTQIGIMKALGFYSIQIKVHYALYGLVVSITGTIIGYLIAPYTITPALLDLQKDFYSLPNWNGENSIFSIYLIVLMVLICSATAWLSSSKIVREMPADSLRNEVLESSKKTFFEKIPAFWDSLSFEWRWVIRDAGKKKIRTIIGIIGVLGSMVLLMSSFGVQDTVTEINNRIYGREYSYYEKLKLNNASDETISSINEKLSDDCQWIYEGMVESQSSEKIVTENFFVIDRGYYWTLFDTENKIIDLPTDGIVVSKKVATDLSVAENSYISILYNGDNICMKVDQIVDINSPQGIFVSKESWINAGNTFCPNTLLAGDNLNLEDVKEMDAITETVSLESQYDDAGSIMLSVKGVILMLLAAAVLLSVVILYNLGLLNYTEKYREYATLRVLGAYNKEIKDLIFKNSILTIVIGWLIGTVAGWMFLTVYVRTVSTSSIVYSPYLKISSYVLSTIIALGCSFVVNVIVSKKAVHIDMVESLKSVE
ncbi:putative ABC transport system permease protein [Butyrivibrio hungatei]|uniref:Putative ABC transport system permease protein n=1 Tax=Butyrivibrio hungatei TaxID=185008 RepID=A0A1G5FAC6_9FIRM|nr:ABC transporter permease [Butyrivibrio hungatei]MBQ4219122.1 ABC transporter permease [Butyrivibrio sp.]SCY36215.1 putative ABC transport system permease protein [Butyrivibrio hungatei]